MIKLAQYTQGSACEHFHPHWITVSYHGVESPMTTGYYCAIFPFCGGGKKTDDKKTKAFYDWATTGILVMIPSLFSLFWKSSPPHGVTSRETGVSLDPVPSGPVAAVVFFILCRCFTSEKVFRCCHLHTILCLRHLEETCVLSLCLNAYESVSIGALYYSEEM